MLKPPLPWCEESRLGKREGCRKLLRVDRAVKLQSGGHPPGPHYAGGDEQVATAKDHVGARAQRRLAGDARALAGEIPEAHRLRAAGVDQGGVQKHGLALRMPEIAGLDGQYRLLEL